MYIDPAIFLSEELPVFWKGVSLFPAVLQYDRGETEERMISRTYFPWTSRYLVIIVFYGSDVNVSFFI